MKSHYRLKVDDSKELEFIGTYTQARKAFNALMYALNISPYKEMKLYLDGKTSSTCMATARFNGGGHYVV